MKFSLSDIPAFEEESTCVAEFDGLIEQCAARA